VNPEAVALWVLAAAVVVAGDRVGADRLHAVVAGVRGAPPVAVRPAWTAVAVASTGALVGVAAQSAVAGVLGAAVAAGLGAAAGRIRDRPRVPDDAPADLAAAWAQLAVCLEVGLPVAAAVAAATEPLDGRVGTELRRVAGLLALGADPTAAWAGARSTPELAAFARAAGRSAGTGAALARSARTEGTRLRAALTDAAEARAQRAAVLITAPLGLCFLPAFLVLGIVPVVLGLADDALRGW
jgi:pilus assembly protein TadC